MDILHSENINSFIPELKKDLKAVFRNCKEIAIKIHFGEPGNKFALTPEQVKPITDLLKKLGINYFLFDTSVSYDSVRNNPEAHKKWALEKGWGKLGEIRLNDNFIVSKGKRMDYEVAKSLADADGVLIISHFKGHYCSGFGGAIKNLGMGALTRKSKQAIHENAKPIIVGKCIQCKACERACPMDGIKVEKEPKFNICYGCSNCIYACPNNVLKPKLDFFDVLLADGANTAQKKFKKFYYISFLTNISRDCDCESNPREIIAKNKGYLAGKDAVAIDKAGYDLITENGKNDVFMKYNKKSGLKHVEAAEKLGMGSSKYKK
jgi:hypothetical protein